MKKICLIFGFWASGGTSQVLGRYRQVMKLFYYIVFCSIILSCSHNSTSKSKMDRWYFLTSCRNYIEYIDKPSFDTTHLRKISGGYFWDEWFKGEVIKYTNEPTDVDAGGVFYLAKDIGIIYSKSTTWNCYSRLHSSNDSTEKRINDYIEHILSHAELVMAGETPTPIKYIESKRH